MDPPTPLEQPNPSTAELDRLDTRSLLRLINDEDRRAALAVETQVDTIARVVDDIAERLRLGGSLHYFGAGTSGRLGVLDAAEIPPTFSVDAGIVVAHVAGGSAAITRAVEAAEDDEEAGRIEVRTAGIGNADAVVGISASGRAAYVIGALRQSRLAGAMTVALTNSPESLLAAGVDVTIVLDTGPEALAGSTRMKAAAAQKMALTMISTAVMVKLGKVYGNLMVDVAPSNKKLRWRAVWLTASIARSTEDAARDALAACGYRVKVAIIMLVRSCGAADAQAVLDQAGGSLRNALDAAR